MTAEMVGHVLPHPIAMGVVIIALTATSMILGRNDVPDPRMTDVDETIDDDHPSLWTFP